VSAPVPPATLRRPADEVHPAAGDGERLRPGGWSQPANSASSLAYLVAGAWLWRRRRCSAHPAAAAAYALAVAANGAGGVAFHGRGDPASHWLHDTALVATLGLVLAEDAVLLRPARPVVQAAVAALAAGAAAATRTVRPTATNLLSGVLAAVIGAEELALLGGGRLRGRPGRARAVASVALVAGGAANLLGRTDGPCWRPDARLQGHAVWHVLTAAALAAWDADEEPGQAAPQRSAGSRRRARRLAVSSL
jgi:hypothetical protein